jgi:hypothetical protein
VSGQGEGVWAGALSQGGPTPSSPLEPHSLTLLAFGELSLPIKGGKGALLKAHPLSKPLE